MRLSNWFPAVALMALVALPLVVPRALMAAPLATKKTPPPHSVNLNTASLSDLMTLPGIGMSRAQAILDFRRKNGAFRSVNDLLVIHGISKKRLDLIRPYIVVGAPPPHPQPAKSKPTVPKSPSTAKLPPAKSSAPPKPQPKTAAPPATNAGL